MSYGITDDVNFLGDIDYTELLKGGRFTTATIVTQEIDPDSNKQFKASEEDEFVDTVEITPEGHDLPLIARLISVKVNVRGSSTDSRVIVYQSSARDEIDQVADISDLSVSDTPQTFTLGAGLGIPYVNKDRENQIYFEVEELSDNSSEYDIEVNWVNIPG